MKQVKGVVVRFDRRKGFGFIQPKREGEKQVFVHWKDIVSDEQWPALKVGTEVQFTINNTDSKGAKAEKVKLAGGKKVTCERDDREVDEETIYTGTVKFFAGKDGYGFIIPDEDIEFMDATCSSEDTEDNKGGLYIAREDVLFAEGSAPNLNYGTKVQFQVYKSDKGLGACRVQNEDGTAYEYKKSTKKRKFKNKGGANKK